MKFFCQNTKVGLIPLYPSDLDEKKKLKKDKVYACEIKFERNYEFLKKFFALVKFGQMHSKKVEMPLEPYRNYITMKAGFAEIYKTPKGIMPYAKSIAFGSMNAEEFEQVYSSVLDAIIIDTEADEELIKAGLIDFL